MKSILAAFLCITAWFLSTQAFSQDKATDKTGTEKTVKGRTPTGWVTILKLPADQKAEMYKVSATYKTKIQELYSKIDELKHAEYKEMVKLLTPDQKKALKARFGD